MSIFLLIFKAKYTFLKCQTFFFTFKLEKSSAVYGNLRHRKFIYYPVIQIQIKKELLYHSRDPPFHARTSLPNYTCIHIYMPTNSRPPPGTCQRAARVHFLFYLSSLHLYVTTRMCKNMCKYVWFICTMHTE